MGAFTVPLPAGKVEAWKSFIGELMGPRRRELDEMHARLDLTEHRAFLDETSPDAPRVIVVASGPGSGDFLRRLARSRDAFDRWFVDQISDLHGFDFRGQIDNLPAPAEAHLDWRATPARA